MYSSPPKHTNTHTMYTYEEIPILSAPRKARQEKISASLGYDTAILSLKIRGGIYNKGVIITDS